MATWTIWLQFLGFIVPMVISPGPGNTILAAMGTQYRIKGSICFWIGFEIGDLFLSALYAFGLGEFIHASHGAVFFLKWAGILFLAYLTWTFIQAAFQIKKADQPSSITHLGLIDGFLSVCLNPKIHTMLLALFSQSTWTNSTSMLIQMIIGFMLVSILSHGLWIISGQVLLSRLRSIKAQRLLNLFFALSIALSAISLL